MRQRGRPGRHVWVDTRDLPTRPHVLRRCLGHARLRLRRVPLRLARLHRVRLRRVPPHHAPLLLRHLRDSARFRTQPPRLRSPRALRALSLPSNLSSPHAPRAQSVLSAPSAPSAPSVPYAPSAPYAPIGSVLPTNPAALVAPAAPANPPAPTVPTASANPSLLPLRSRRASVFAILPRESADRSVASPASSPKLCRSKTFVPRSC
jgi:hypothetical protein